MDGDGTAPPPPPAGDNNSTPAPNGGGFRVQNCYVFKSRLQEYAQKANLPTPEYHTLKTGPPHEPVFMSTVVINGTKHDSLPGFFTRKSAEQSAAEAALMEIAKSIPTNGSIPAVQETGLCKNLLQEYAQKMNYAIPSYAWNKQASGKAPFTCTVEIGGIQYIGASARTKKEAEIKAARTALLAIHDQLESSANGATKFIVVPAKRQVRKTEKKPIETPKPLKVKKGGFKKKWNKRKFMKKNSQAADVEKDQPRVAVDVINQMSPCSQQSAQEPSSDTAMLQPDVEAKRVEQEPPSDTAMLHPDEEAMRVEQEPSSNTAVLLPDEDARRVEQEPPSDTAMLHPDEEAMRVEQEPSSDTAMLLPDEDARRVQQEPHRPSVTAMLRTGEEARRVEQEPLRPSVTAMLQPSEEARRVEHEPSSDTAMLQTGEEARTVELEPSTHTAIVISNEEGVTINQEPPNDTAKYAMPRDNKEARTVNHDSPANNQKPPSNAATTQLNEKARTVSQEPSVENSESACEGKNRTSENASVETDNSVEDVRRMDSDFRSPSSSMTTE